MARNTLPEILAEFLVGISGSFRLRPEQPADEIFLRVLFDASRPLAGQLAHVPADLRETILRGQFLAQSQVLAAQYPQGTALIILVGEEPAGRLLFDAVGEMLHIADIALLPGQRGQGIGTALLQALVAAAPRGLSLDVADDNFAAQRLYARLGFVLTGQAPGYLHLARLGAG